MKLNLIGIGSFSTKLVDRLKDDDCLYTTFDKNLAGFDLESNETAYRADYSDVIYDLSNIQETYCFVDCKEGIAGISLSLLEKLESKDITIFLLVSNCQSTVEKTNHKIIYNVLQEYARSGVFKSLFIINRDILFENIIKYIPDNEDFSINDIDNKLIDKVIFGVHIYWRLNNETYIEGESVRFQDTIYRIKTFFDQIGETEFAYENMQYIGSKIWVKGLKEKMQKQDLLNLQKFKKIVKEEGSRYVLLNSDFDFVLGIAESKIVQ